MNKTMADSYISYPILSATQLNSTQLNSTRRREYSHSGCRQNTSVAIHERPPTIFDGTSPGLTPNLFYRLDYIEHGRDFPRCPETQEPLVRPARAASCRRCLHSSLLTLLSMLAAESCSSWRAAAMLEQRASLKSHGAMSKSTAPERRRAGQALAQACAWRPVRRECNLHCPSR